MDETLIYRLRQNIDPKIIGIVGATRPTEEYVPQMGIEIGYSVRKIINEKGTVFTGGVDGVGIDVYTGIMKFCIDALRKTGEMPPDKFFVLVPEYEDIIPGRFTDMGPYFPPQAYSSLAALSSTGKLEIARAGADMAERREYVPRIADFLVMANGGLGTFEEGIFALQVEKPLVALSYTGGAARLFKMIKDGNLPENVLGQLKTSGIGLEKIINKIDASLIQPAESIPEMAWIIDKLMN